MSALLEVRALEWADPDGLVLDERQARVMEGFDWRKCIRDAAEMGPVWTALWAGRAIGIAGVSTMWTGRGMSWCYLAPEIPQWAWPGLHRAVGLRLDDLQAGGLRRIEAEVRQGFVPGSRWANMLGFRCEGISDAYFPDGAACERWARVR